MIHCGEATFEKDEDFELAEDGGESNYFIDATNQTQIIHDDAENQIQGLISGNTLSSANNQQYNSTFDAEKPQSNNLIFATHGTMGSKGSGDQRTLNYCDVPVKSKSFQ